MTADHPERPDGAGRPVIDVVDPFDDDVLRAWHDVYHEAESAGRPYASPYAFEEIRVSARAKPVSMERLLLSGSVDGELVCTAEADLPLKDNLFKAEVRVHTHPAHRRRGYGAAMVRDLEARLAARGRTVLTAMVDHDYDAGPSGRGQPGVEFWESAGYVHALGDVKRSLALPIPDDRLEGLEEDVRRHLAAYSLRSFVDRCPDDLVESLGRLIGTLMTEAPMGDLVVEDEVFDEERIRHQEEVAREAGRTAYFTVAQAPSGEVVAYTQLMAPRHEPGRAYQWGTLVDPAHRGHRLGLAVKVANHRLLQRCEPGVKEVMTYNAEVNEHMIGVNEALGYVPVARCAEFQKTLAGTPA